MYCNTMTDPYLNLKVLTLKTIDQVFSGTQEFPFSFFIDTEDQFSNDDDWGDFEENYINPKIPTPLFEALVKKHDTLNPIPSGGGASKTQR